MTLALSAPDHFVVSMKGWSLTDDVSADGFRRRCLMACGMSLGIDGRSLKEFMKSLSLADIDKRVKATAMTSNHSTLSSRKIISRALISEIRDFKCKMWAAYGEDNTKANTKAFEKQSRDQQIASNRS